MLRWPSFNSHRQKCVHSLPSLLCSLMTDFEKKQQAGLRLVALVSFALVCC